ncbi:hypothetical protein T08_3797 [Trichinella sp. T8]|nr:hypothetical protein T08_3797 [Trichinella sp. T8]
MGVDRWTVVTKWWCWWWIFSLLTSRGPQMTGNGPEKRHLYDKRRDVTGGRQAGRQAGRPAGRPAPNDHHTKLVNRWIVVQMRRPALTITSPVAWKLDTGVELNVETKIQSTHAYAHGLNPIKSTFNGEPFETETVELRWLKMKLGGKPEVRQAVRCFCIPVAAVLRCGSFPSVANKSKKPKLREVQAVIKGDRGGTIDQRANGNAKEKKKEIIRSG